MIWEGCYKKERDGGMLWWVALAIGASFGWELVADECADAFDTKTSSDGIAVLDGAVQLHFGEHFETRVDFYAG